MKKDILNQTLKSLFKKEEAGGLRYGNTLD